MEETPTTSAATKRLLLIANCLILSVGTCGGPLIKRLYFVRGGHRIWFSSWQESGGFLVILIPLLINYTRRRRSCNNSTRPKLILMNLRVFLATAVIGLLTGLDDYLYAYGVAKLPVSTSSLILATQLVFTAVFAFLMVKQRLTACSINAVVLLTMGAVVLGMNVDGDRPAGERNREYLLGFVMTLGAAALYGGLLPVAELVYMKAKQAVTYTLVMEIQFVMCFFATVFCTLGMIVNKDFQAISREAKEYELGETKYYMVIISNTMMWQCFFLGANGVIFYSSSLLSGIIIALMLPATELLALLFFEEKFNVEKGISLFLSLWGFISYFYGEIKDHKKKKMMMKKEGEEEDNGCKCNDQIGLQLE